MKRLLCLVLWISIVSFSATAQLVGYNKDEWKVYSVIDTNDRKKIAPLKESLEVIAVTIDTMHYQLSHSIHLEERRLNLATSRILVAIYNNLSRQIILYEKKVFLMDTLQNHLAILKVVNQRDKTNYGAMKRTLGFSKVFREYIKVNYKADLEDERLTKDLKWILNNDGKNNNRKDILGEFINYFTTILKGIEVATVQPSIDSLSNELAKLSINAADLENKIEDLRKERTKIKDASRRVSASLKAQKKESQIKDSLLKTQDSLLNKGQERRNDLVDRLALVTETLNETEKKVHLTNNNRIKLRNEQDKMLMELDSIRKSKIGVALRNKALLEENAALEKKKIAYQQERDELLEIEELKNMQLLILLCFLGVLSLFGYSIKKSRDISKRQAVLLQLKTKELKSSNTQLQDKTEELKLSHRELQHRTKNNLQKVINLIYIKKFSIKDQKARSILQLLQDELDTIALIHQKLYVGENQKLTIVNVADYVDELVRYLVGDAAKVYTEVDDIFIEMDNAVEIGLILNELVTNARKYSFPSVPQPEISVKIKMQEPFICMKIKDNGHGFPTNIFTIDNSTFGLMAIADVVKRHENKGSTIQLYNENGAVVKLQLPFDEELGRLTA